MEFYIKEESENMPTEDCLEFSTVDTNVADYTAVKEETEDKEDPLLVKQGNRYLENKGSRQTLN